MTSGPTPKGGLYPLVSPQAMGVIGRLPLTDVSVDRRQKRGPGIPGPLKPMEGGRNRLSTLGRAKFREGSPTGAMLTKQKINGGGSRDVSVHKLPAKIIPARAAMLLSARA